MTNILLDTGWRRDLDSLAGPVELRLYQGT